MATQGATYAFCLDYARTDRLQDDWLILDAADASLGPSAWKIKTSSEKSTPAGIHQVSTLIVIRLHQRCNLFSDVFNYVT